MGRTAVGRNIVALMLQEYERFTKSEKKIVDYVLEHLRETQYISITDLSAACDVAVSTISVFCRKLKLAGFNDFKLELARASLMTDGRSAVGPAHEEILSGDSLGTVMEKSLNTAQGALNKAYHMLRESAVRRASDLIEAARQVLCLGQGNHSVVAMATWALFSTATDKFRTVQDAHLQTVALATLAPEDVVLYFSYSGATHELLETAELIRARGARLILVTCFLNAPASAYADTVLLCGPNEQPLKFGSTAAMMAQLYVSDVLFGEYCRRNREATDLCRQSVGKALTQKCI